MWQALKKIWIHTTTNTKTGEYSMKRLQVFGAYFFAIILSLTNVVNLNIWPEQAFAVTPAPEWLVFAWIGVALGQSFLTMKGKLQNRKTADENGNPLEPIGSEHPNEE